MSPPKLFLHQQSMCSVSPPSIHLYVRCPPPQLILDPSWSMTVAKFVSPSVALPAELVYSKIKKICFTLKLIFLIIKKIFILIKQRINTTKKIFNPINQIFVMIKQIIITITICSKIKQKFITSKQIFIRINQICMRINKYS